MAAKSGGEHHFTRAREEKKQLLIARVSSGLSVPEASALVGVKSDVLKKWLAEDRRFAARLDEANAEGARTLAAALGPDGDKRIDFATFSKEFLGMQVFPHQQSWIDVLEGREPSFKHPAMTFEPGNRNRLLINVPPEHAKSTVITVGFATYLIAMNPNIRIVIVSQTQTRAKEFLFSIKQRLTEERWAKLQQVYGPAGGYKATADQWTQDRIYLERDSGEKDPTVQALGLGQQIYGTRADVIILDDVVGTTNAHEWEKQLDWLQKMVITRVGKNGKIVIVGTRVSSVDLYKEIRNPDRWSGDTSPFTYLAMPAVLEFHNKPEEWVTLWPKSDRPWDGEEDSAEPDENGLYEKWSGRALFSRRSEVSPSTWAMVYQQQDVEEDAVFPPQLVNACINRMRKPGPIKFGAPGHPKDGKWVTLIGMDPAMTGKTAFVAYAIERQSGKRLVLDVHNMSDPTPQKIRDQIENWVNRYNPMELIVEINAHQKAYALDAELNSWLAEHGVRMKEHFTGKNKWDTNFGVAGMSGLFGHMRDGKPQKADLIELPDATNEHVKALIQQLITWKADTRNATDCVMALWFCEIRAKELISRNNHRMTHIPNRWATRANLDRRGVISLNDAFTEDYLIYQ